MGAVVSNFVMSVIKMIFLAAVSLGGIFLGKTLRDRKDAKKAAGENE
ncbi:MAG: hypothetical protein SOZ59_00020 [Candidatus Limivivens sp.]|nr:hypothetical protein [Candidatus Limivivens sp.]